jgi:hypothetical protein
VLDTVSLSGNQWAVVIGLSLISPVVLAIDKAIQIAQLKRAAKVA